MAGAVEGDAGGGFKLAWPFLDAEFVVDVIDDPKRVSNERKETILKFLHNKTAFD